MSKIAIYTITSGLHDEKAVSALSDSFLSEIFPDGNFDFKGSDFSDFGCAPLNLIYIRTGGAEGIFRQLLPKILNAGSRKLWLLASGSSNSLAASMEILSYLRSKGLPGEILHGCPEVLRQRIGSIASIASASASLRGGRIGIVGKPSDWLIASSADQVAVREKLGLEMVDIPMEQLIEYVKRQEEEPVPECLPMKRDIRSSWSGAWKIYRALKSLREEYGLTALTVRCFDLLTSVGNTGCIALSQLNAEGTPASCEGDVPALLSMMISKALAGTTGFQANPSRIDPDNGEILFAHCTIPADIPSSITYDTHFESGIGVGLHGEFPEGPVTVFKVSGDLKRHFTAEGALLRNQYEDNLCRTQVILRISPEKARYFLEDPIGNHHIIIPGHNASLLDAFCQNANCQHETTGSN